MVFDSFKNLCTPREYVMHISRLVLKAIKGLSVFKMMATENPVFVV